MDNELTQVIGELYVSRGRLKLEYDKLMDQVNEMAEVITQLRERVKELENGRLVKSFNNDPV